MAVRRMAYAWLTALFAEMYWAAAIHVLIGIAEGRWEYTYDYFHGHRNGHICLVGVTLARRLRN